MILFNKTTNMVDYDGPTARFAGVDAYKNPQLVCEFEIRLTDDEKLALFRNKVTDNAGDALRQQGSLADACQMTMLAMGSLLSQLKAGKPIDEIIDSDPAFGLCIEFSQAHEADTMKLPFKQKPPGEAIKDIIHRTNAVAELYSN